MTKVFVSRTIPSDSLLLSKDTVWDYTDSMMIKKDTKVPIDKITTELFRSPKWIALLMLFRNSIVKYFGLKTEATTINESSYYPVGSKAMVFTVIDRNNNEIVCSEDDQHLLFLTSILHKPDVNEIYVTTTVKYHNKWGKIYFFFIKPFHRIVVKTLTKRMWKSI